tara:strand:+ start:466 stop:699 length:234 start_codon:yes stop_codon:yes gene_type:complete
MTTESMKCLLFSLLATLAVPASASAEGWWLLVKQGEGLTCRSYSWRIPTNSESDCNNEKIKVVKTANWQVWQNIKKQ